MKKLISMLAIMVALGSCSGNATTKGRTITAQDTADNCDNPAVSAKIQKIYLLQTVYDYTPEEAQNWLGKYETGTLPTQGLTGFEIDTTYYGHCILGISYHMEGMGAYPSSYTGYINYNLKTGDTLRTSDFIASDKMNDLVMMCNNKLQQHIADSRKALATDIDDGHNELDSYIEDVDNYLEQYPPVFTQDNVGSYRISNADITWIYEFNFPHYMQALEPDGNLRLSVAELQPLLRKDGPLGFMAK